MKKHYQWHTSPEAPDSFYYDTPNFMGLCKQEDGYWKWCVFNPGGFLIASEYQLASKQNAQRRAVEYITAKEKEIERS